MTNTVVHPEQILKDLSELWVSLGREKEGVLRACTMTLLVIAEEAEDPQGIGETIAALMPEHPSRVILIRTRAADARELSARVYSQCWMPFGQRQQICCEQIEITASDPSVPDLASVALALVAPDLPVMIWCRSPRLFGHPDFPKLGAIAGKVIVDGAQLGSPRQALKTLSEFPGRRVADLAWTRLTRWRQLIAQIFDKPENAAKLTSIRDVQVHHSGAEVPIEGYYFAAWLDEALPDAAAIFTGDEGEAGHLSLVQFECGEAPVSIGLSQGQAADLRMDDLAAKSICPEPSEYLLLREELGIPGVDPVYERTLRAALRLALSS
jgi:glucose-6-phosphate dehydrogenase assembly protein OpcA